MSGSPVREHSRAWLVVLCLAPLPIGVTLVLDVSRTGMLIAVILSSALLLFAAFVWAVQRERRRVRDFEARLASWAAKRAVAEERLRIARDLHDLSSHGLGLITVQAASTAYLVGPDADDARKRAMTDIERIGRATSVELRRMLTLLRSEDQEAAPLRPAEMIADIPHLIREAERAGLAIEYRLCGLDENSVDDAGLDGSVQLAVCAVVRESLTNVLRHAGPTTVRLVLSRDANSVQVTVDDDGALPGWRPARGAGHGLPGLRERVAVHGGTISACAIGRSFRLHAVIPVGNLA